VKQRLSVYGWLKGVSYVSAAAKRSTDDKLHKRENLISLTQDPLKMLCKSSLCMLEIGWRCMLLYMSLLS